MATCRHTVKKPLANRSVPTVVRFLTILAILAALIYAAMFALATFVQPRQGQYSERIDINLKPLDPPPPAPEAAPDADEAVPPAGAKP